MISAAARPYIDASVPVLREHGLAITRVFYRNMFAAHPELTNLFNMGNQASGVQQQSLAAAVIAYAANIDNAAALGPVASRIAHKHASVGIRANHYPIVGKHLLGAIQEVLGEAATPALISAWGEAYTSLADALIAAEQGLYTQANVAPGALREVKVVDVQVQSEEVKSFTLAAVDGQALPDFRPGQYLSVSVVLPDGRTQLRQYSLSDTPNGRTWRISVKREPETGNQPPGMVSNWLHGQVQPGDTLQVTHPFGDFTPDAESTTPIVMLSAGIGITPMIAVLNRIAQANPQRQVVFGHAARNAKSHAHRADIAAVVKQMPQLQVAIFYEDLAQNDTAAGVLAGRMRVTQLPVWDRDAAEVYLCGPVGFMQQQWAALLEAGVPAAKLHREVFGPELLNYLN